MPDSALPKADAVLDLMVRAGVSTYFWSGDNLMVGCPRAPYTDGHRNIVDRQPSMGIWVREGAQCVVHCYSCKYRTVGLQRLFSNLAACDGEKFAQLRADAARIEGEDVLRSLDRLQGYERAASMPAPENEGADEALWEPCAGRWHPYLAARGVEKATAKRWDSGFDRDWGMVMFPARRYGGKLLGAVGRGVSSTSKHRHFNYWGLDKAGCLFGEQLCRPGTAFVVVEGVFDALLVYQALWEGDLLDHYSVVSTLGSAVSAWQAKRLVELSSTVVLAYDRDRAGVVGEKLAAKSLSRRLVTLSVSMPPVFPELSALPPSQVREAVLSASLSFV